MQHLPKNHIWISLVVLLVALSIVTPVFADYLGPDRTVTQTGATCTVNLYECRIVNGRYREKKVEDWSCSSESKPWDAYPSHASCHAAKDVGNKHWERDEGVDTTTDTYPEATIAGSIQNCILQNDWCVGTAPQLALSANEPVPGYNILLIEGTLNGASFACQGGQTSCNVPLNEGNNDFNYWAISSWGDSSTMGSSTARVDTVAPDAGLDIRSVAGLNGWYVSPATVTAIGSDVTSGVASAVLSTDNITWQPSMTLKEGVYKVAVSVTDNAGNVTDSSIPISVDTTTPIINGSLNGTAGHNGWYKSDIDVSATSSDATSGVATFEVAVDGAAYQNYIPVTFNDGRHTLQYKAVDVAGNQTETAVQEFYIDTSAPTVDLPASWQLGKNVPYSVQDDGSGLAALRIVIEDEDEKYAKVAWNEDVSGQSYSQDINWSGQFKDKTVAPPGTYLVWIKASDRAGNERFELGKIIVPDPNGSLNLLPVEEPAAEAGPRVLPDELFETGEEAPPVTNPPALGFGGATTQPGEATTQSILLTTGLAGTVPSTTSSDILWGAAAAAVIGAVTAYALEAARRREEAEEAQAKAVQAQVAQEKAKRAENRLTKEEKAEQVQEHDERVKERKERQEWANPAEEKAKLKEQEERDQGLRDQTYLVPSLQQHTYTPPPYWISPETQDAYLYGGENAQNWINQNVPQLQQEYIDQQEAMRQQERETVSNALADQRAEKYDALEEANWIAAQIAIQEKQDEKYKAEAEAAAAGNAAMLANLPGYFDSEKQAPTSVVTAPKETSWLENAKSFIQQKIVQPYVQPVVNAIDQYVYQPYIQPVIEKVEQTEVYKTVENALQPKNILPALLTAVLGANTLQWINNVKSNPDIFLSADTYTQSLFENMEAEHPRTPETRSLSYLLTHPYEAVDTGSDFLNLLTSVSASYADAIWQQNPLVQMQVQNLKALEASTCSQISNQAWSNRCTATFYLAAGWTATPFDTGLGALDGFIVNPVSGFIKQFALTAETVEQIPGLIDAFQEGGLQGAWDFGKEVFQRNLDIIWNDEQLQSAYFLEGLLLLAPLVALVAGGTVAAAVVGGIVAGTAIEGLMDIDTAVATAQDKNSLIDFVTSHSVRTGIITGILMLALIVTGLGKKALDFRAVEEKLPPEAQWNFQNKPLAEQMRIAELAAKMKLSPKALEFYLKNSVDPASGLSKLPLEKALQVSSFVDVDGEQALSTILPFCERYGINPYELLTRTRAEGQSLFGLVLGIESRENPVNYPLVRLNLTETELNGILERSLKNPDSKIVVLGYGNGVAKPYYELGKDITGSYISLSNEDWAPFENARANFWVQINGPFIEAAIKQRKIFLFNVEYDVILDEANIRRFSLPELRLIQLEQNNYVQVPVGKYTAFVPAELIDTYEQYLPAILFESGE